MLLYNTCRKYHCYGCQLWGECKPHLVLKLDKDTLIKNFKNKVELPKLKEGEE